MESSNNEMNEVNQQNKPPEAPKLMPELTKELKMASYQNRLNIFMNDIDQIVPKLFIGNIDAANDVEKLKSLNITHILTLEDCSLDPKKHSKFNYKFKKLADHPYSNILDILEECIEFIDEGVTNSTGVLVHCLAGISRSASILIAYLMYKNNKPFRETYEFVKLIRNVEPNFGFKKQLQLFETMSHKVSRESPVYKSFVLSNMAEQIKLGNKFYRVHKNESTETASASASSSNENVPCYKCKKCRFRLFDKSNVVIHLKGYVVDNSKSWKTKLAYYRELNKNSKLNDSNGECSQVFYIEPLDWFLDKLEDISGKLNCPKCDAKIGSFDWVGSNCPCGTWVVPDIHIAASKVDISR